MRYELLQFLHYTAFSKIHNVNAEHIAQYCIIFCPEYLSEWSSVQYLMTHKTAQQNLIIIAFFP